MLFHIFLVRRSFLPPVLLLLTGADSDMLVFVVGVLEAVMEMSMILKKKMLRVSYRELCSRMGTACFFTFLSSFGTPCSSRFRFLELELVFTLSFC